MIALRALPGMLPYLAAMFLNAFVDLGHKIVIQNTLFKVYDGTVQVVLTALLNALILLPYILLFTPAGFCSDRFPKHRVMRASAWGAVGLTLLITLSYYQGWFWPAFALTFLMGVQSAFYSPAKYGYLKPLVGKERLARGNGAVQAVTIIAILAGTMVYSVLFEARFDRLGGDSREVILQAIAPLGWLLVANSLMELALAYRLPALEVGSPGLRLAADDYFRGRTLRTSLAPLRRRAAIRVPVIGLAMFWSVSQVVLAAFPAFAKESLGITNTVLLQGMLASTGIGILLGSLLAGRWSRHHIETGLIPLGGLGLAAGLLMLPWLDAVWLHCANFILIGIVGGLFIVPLNALIQFHAAEHELGKVLAGSNLIQNIAMLALLVVTAAVAQAGVATRPLLVSMAAVAIAGALYTVLRLPQSLLRLGIWKRVEVVGFEHLPEQGALLLVGGKGGWREWALLQIASPRSLHLIVDRPLLGGKWLRRCYRLSGQDVTVLADRLEQGEGAWGWLDDRLAAGEAVCLLSDDAPDRARAYAARLFEQGHPASVIAATVAHRPRAMAVAFEPLPGVAGTKLQQAEPTSATTQ